MSRNWAAGLLGALASGVSGGMKADMAEEETLRKEKAVQDFTMNLERFRSEAAWKQEQQKQDQYVIPAAKQAQVDELAQIDARGQWQVDAAAATAAARGEQDKGLNALHQRMGSEIGELMAKTNQQVLLEREGRLNATITNLEASRARSLKKEEQERFDTQIAEARRQLTTPEEGQKYVATYRDGLDRLTTAWSNWDQSRESLSQMNRMIGGLDGTDPDAGRAEPPEYAKPAPAAAPKAEVVADPIPSEAAAKPASEGILDGAMATTPTAKASEWMSSADAKSAIEGYKGKFGELAAKDDPNFLIAKAEVRKEGDRPAWDVYGEIIERETKGSPISPGLAKAVMLAESRANPKAVSGKGAAGLFQLMQPTAKDRGLDWADRFDPEKNIKAGVAHLKWLHQFFGNDTVRLIAAYNAGHRAVQQTKSEYGVPVDEKGETRGYVARVLKFLSAV